MIHSQIYYFSNNGYDNRLLYILPLEAIESICFEINR